MLRPLALFPSLWTCAAPFNTMRLWLPLVVLAGLVILRSTLRDPGTVSLTEQHVSVPSVHSDNAPPTVHAEPLVQPIVWQPEDSFSDPARTIEFKHGERAAFHPHGEQVCASGCAVSHHPTERLTRWRFQQLLADYAIEPLEEPGEAFETLLYFGRQASALLEREGTGALDPSRALLLQRELQRTSAEVSIRLVDESGIVRGSLPPTLVPLDRRHEFELEPHNLQPLIASGTVKRVGRDHVWTRL